MRVGIMSFAHLHAEAYIQNVRNIAGVEFIGFSDQDPARGQHFAELYDAHWFDTHEALLAEQPDAVIICSENAHRRELVEMAAEAKVHVLCEKPIEINMADAKAMRDVCAANHVKFMTAFPVRYMPSLVTAKAKIEQGDLGEIYAINGINHSTMPYGSRFWFSQKELAGGGSVMDHTVHLVDAMRWLFGCEVTEVYAEVGNLFYPGQVEIDTAGIVLVSFENGLFASIDCSWSRPPAAYPTWGHVKMDIVGSGGFIKLDGFAQYLNVYSNRSTPPGTRVGWGPDINQYMIDDFIASVREDREPSITWNDGYQALRVALACYESAETGQPVRLNQDTF